MFISESKNDKQQNRGKRGLQHLPQPPPAPPHPPRLQKRKTAAKFASQGDAHERNDAQIKFLYYPLV